MKKTLLPYLAKTASYVDFDGLPPTSQEELRHALGGSGSTRAFILRALVADYRNDLALAIVQCRAAQKMQPSNPDIQSLLRSAESRRQHG